MDPETDIDVDKKKYPKHFNDAHTRVIIYECVILNVVNLFPERVSSST